MENAFSALGNWSKVSFYPVVAILDAKNWVFWKETRISNPIVERQHGSEIDFVLSRIDYPSLIRSIKQMRT